MLHSVVPWITENVAINTSGEDTFGSTCRSETKRISDCERIRDSDAVGHNLEVTTSDSHRDVSVPLDCNLQVAQ
jgi:hypothetical protein